MTKLTDKAPLVIFLYNRPAHSQALFESVVRCDGILGRNIYVYIDGVLKENHLRSHKEVIDVVRTFEKILPLDLIVSSENLGLANSVIRGVTKTLLVHSTCIVLEDDLILKENFLIFMDESLESYKLVSEVISISGYQPFKVDDRIKANYEFDNYLSTRTHSWGWATWRDRWEEVDWEISKRREFFENRDSLEFFAAGGSDLIGMLFDQISGRINSWAIRFAYDAALRNKYTLYPISTLVLNRGFDGSGIHCGENPSIQRQEFEEHASVANLMKPSELQLHADILLEFWKHYSLSRS